MRVPLSIPWKKSVYPRPPCNFSNPKKKLIDKFIKHILILYKTIYIHYIRYIKFIHIGIRFFNKFNKNPQSWMHIMGRQLTYWFRDHFLTSQILCGGSNWNTTNIFRNEWSRKIQFQPRQFIYTSIWTSTPTVSATSEFVTEFMDSANEGCCRQKVKCTKVKLEFVMTARNPIGR